MFSLKKIGTSRDSMNEDLVFSKTNIQLYASQPGLKQNAET